MSTPVVDTILFFVHTHSSSSPELYYFWSGWHNLCTNGQALHNCTSSYCPVHKWLHKLHNGVLHNSDLSQLGGTQAVVPLHAFSPAALPVFCTRGGGAPPGQIPRFTFHGQFVTISLKEQFPVVFWRIWSILFGILDFQSQNIIKEEKMKIYSASSKIPSGQVVQSSHWPCCMCSLNLTAVRSNPAGQQSNRSNFFQMNLKSAILKSQPPPFPLWEVGAGMGERAGEILKIILSLTLSVLNCGVHCPRNPIQIWTLYQPSPRTYNI